MDLYRFESGQASLQPKADHRSVRYIRLLFQCAPKLLI